LPELEGERVNNWDKQLARIIDHTILRPDATEEDVRRACREACDYRFAAVVVPPCYVSLAVRATGGKGIRICSVVSFPFGWDTTDHKLRQTEELLKAGVDEIDAVMNITRFLSGDREGVRKETEEISALCGPEVAVKLIIETACLSEEQIALASSLGVEGGARFIKTSTGYARRGATVEDIRLIKAAVEDRAGIKASGGIRTRSQAEALVQAGATRLGCSASVEVVAAGPPAGSSAG
jgi:deoxyribose-phosphate aldolase